jgi:hypothetical protein
MPISSHKTTFTVDKDKLQVRMSRTVNASAFGGP